MDLIPLDKRKIVLPFALIIFSLTYSYLYNALETGVLFSFLVSVITILFLDKRKIILPLFLIVFSLGYSYFYNALELGLLFSFIVVSATIWVFIRSEMTAKIDKKQWTHDGEARTPPGFKTDTSKKENQ